MKNVLRGRNFGEERLQADGCEFFDCTFDKTTLVFRGKSAFTFTGSTQPLGLAGVDFEGEAGITINQLKMFPSMGMIGLTEYIIASIRNPLGGSVN